MEVVDKKRIHSEAIEVHDIVWKSIETLPEHLMKSKLWLSNVYHALINILVRLSHLSGQDKKTLVAMVEQIWDGFDAAKKDAEKKIN